MWLMTLRLLYMEKIIITITLVNIEIMIIEHNYSLTLESDIYCSIKKTKKMSFEQIFLNLKYN